MKSLAIFFAVLASVLVELEAQHIGYSPEEQENWSQEYPDCGKNQQSPIDILTNKTAFAFTPPINLWGYYEKVPLMLKNNGHSAQVAIDRNESARNSETPLINGGPLSGTYEFLNFHYHWGSEDDRGAEHVIDDSNHPLELHFVHKNTKYATLDEAQQHSDGLAVLGVLFHHSNSDGYEISPIAENLLHIRKYDTTTPLGRNPGKSLRHFFEQVNLEKYYWYQGSLTTPPCSQAVTWIVFQETLAVSSDQLHQFRTLFDDYGNPLVDNYRFLQPLNGRAVFRPIIMANYL